MPTLEHLSDPRRGQIDTLAALPATIGSAGGVDVLVPGAAPFHARLVARGGRVLLEDAGSGVSTLLAGASVHEVALHDGDIVELGRGGPRLRYRADAPVHHGHGRLFDHRDFRITLAVLLMAAAGLLAWTWSLNRQVLLLQAALHGAEAERQALEGRIADERRKADGDRERLEIRIEDARQREEDLDRRLAAAGGAQVHSLRAELRQVRARLVTLEGERAVGERIIRRYGPGVCLIQSSYLFRDAQGRPLRYRLDAAGAKVRDPDGSATIAVDGSGPEHTIDAIGTGFLADARGLVVTNRHVVEPWWKDESAAAYEKDGFFGHLREMQAYFPAIGRAVPVRVRQLSPRFDLAVLEVDLAGFRVPTLPMDANARAAVAGQPVVVLGYPTGLEAILAKADGRVVKEILAGQGTESRRITDALASRGLIRPSSTQGHIGDVTSTDVVFDAATTQGGSGGPVFNKAGCVVAVEYAVLPQFAGNSYGIPIRHVIELLKGAPPAG